MNLAQQAGPVAQVSAWVALALLAFFTVVTMLGSRKRGGRK